MFGRASSYNVFFLASVVIEYGKVLVVVVVVVVVAAVVVVAR